MLGDIVEPVVLSDRYEPVAGIRKSLLCGDENSSLTVLTCEMAEATKGWLRVVRDEPIGRRHSSG